MLRHANHLLSADYINYGKISIQIKDKFSLEMRDSTNEGKTTTDESAETVMVIVCPSWTNDWLEGDVICSNGC